jgi:hypothetical protein
MVEQRISRNRRIVEHHKETGDNTADRLGDPILTRGRIALFRLEGKKTSFLKAKIGKEILIL